MLTRKKILITGRVQGVGFRPAVYRLATELGLTGFVLNDSRGVTIELQGSPDKITSFLSRLQTGPDKPIMAEIKTCQVSDIPFVPGEQVFTIRHSIAKGEPTSEVSPDISICQQCLDEMTDENDFRYHYPFINCTNCGPRYSIVKTIPYDRPNTTMFPFAMCDRCADQYTSPSDRRFHAQPVACPMCGPRIWLTDNNGKIIRTGTEDVLDTTAKFLREGKILAIKGIGGFHLAVDALNNDAVELLRQRKRREHKPFAMMTDSIDKIREFATVSPIAEQVLKEPQRPIVLLPKRGDSAIAPSVAPGVSTFGFMLCYAPLHYLLFARDIKVLVMTSANLSDEPLICKNNEALEKLGDVADAFLMHDREIYRQVDDSIVHLVDEKPVLVRRARGYVPEPITYSGRMESGIIAAGGDLKNTFCLGKGNQFIVSEHIGDLEDALVYRHYLWSIEHLKGLFESVPKTAVCDLHPGYMSTRYAFSKSDLKIIQVQHHWAHIASVLAEHGIDGPVIGIECDGTGYGTDGAIWGCECMIASLEKFERFGHLAYFPLAGGDKASKEAIRPAISLLKAACGSEFTLEKFSWLLDRLEPDKEKQSLILEQLQKNINTVQTSSLGRLFDAMAGLAGLGNFNHFEAQLPMALEAGIDKNVEDGYSFELQTGDDKQTILDFRKIIKQAVEDIGNGANTGVIAARFHNGLAQGLVEMAKAARKATNINIAALSGGVFCNGYLINRLVTLLKRENFTVLFNQVVPANDGGISLGQAAIGARLAGGNKD